ncbi:AAA family ATPase [Methylomagnum ishizawai]|nr:ATP-binding protein [Methylomagnum ishizawai]
MGPLTLLVGANASGKSNLRDAFRFLHGIARGYSLAEIIGEKYGEGGERVWRGIRGGVREFVFQGGNCCEFEADFFLDQKKCSYFLKVNVSNDGTPPRSISEKLILDSRIIFDTEMVFHLEPSDRFDLKVGVRDRDIPIEDEFNPWEYYEFTSLSFRPALNQIAENASNKFINASEIAQEALSAFASMRFLDLDPEALRRPSIPGQTILGDKGENLSSVLQAICQQPESKAALLSWIAELTPMDAVDFEFPADHAGRVLVTLVERSGQRISAYSASDGTLRFLAMIAALLGPDASRFYFFEELDNGIHPARLHLLLGLIERQAALGKVQVVATTHSPELLALLDAKTLEHASLIYRLPDSHEGRIQRILDIPGAAEVIEQQDIAKLHATGWLEDAAYFTSDEDAAA